jgi:hypothetical protein
MNPRRKSWYRTKWGFVLALIFSPFWFIWKKSRRNRFLRTVVGGSAALIAFVLLVLFIGHLFSDRAVKTPNGTTGSNASGDSSVSLSGYGATQAEWNADHTEDNNFTADSSYNPTSGLGNGYTDKYTSVLWIGGRALSYQIGFPGGTSIATAVSTTLQEFPSNATILWQQENTSDSVNICYQMEVHSPTLGQALESDGNTFVEFQTIDTSDTNTGDGYYTNNVNDASLRNADYKKASDVGGC